MICRTDHQLDELRWQPRWKTDLSSIRGQFVRLRFHLRETQLYSFQIQ